MNQWQAVNAVCGYLRSGLLDGPARARYPLTTWKTMLQVAKTHKLTAGLAWCLKGESVPAETRSYLDAVWRLNGKRNQRLLLVTERIVGALNAIDIEPVLLKGIAHVASGVYPAAGLRLVGDLDVLIPKEQAKSAVAAMEQLGFVVGGMTLGDDHHHLPMMRQGEFGAVLELHTRVEHLVAEPIIPVDWLGKRTRPIPFRGLRVRVLDPTASVAHNVHHSQLNHQYYSWKQVEFRQLLDLAMMRARYEREIDWAEIDRRFNCVNHGHVLATYLKYTETFFDQPMPKISSAPRPKAIARLRRGLAEPLEQRHRLAYARRVRREQLAHARRVRRERRARIARALISLPRLYVTARMQDPRGLIKLMNPLTWVRQFKMLAMLLRSP